MLNALGSPYIVDKHYDNACDFIKAISYGGELYGKFDEHFIFRGHSTDEYQLLPSSLRGCLALDNDTSSTFDSQEVNTLKSFLSTTELIQVQTEYRLLQDFHNACNLNGLYVPEIESLQKSFYPGVDGEVLLLGGPWLPKSYWELAALAQHHGVKTRLLDWSHDIYVALYFASTGVFNDNIDKSERHDMELWALNIDVVMVKPTEVPMKIVYPRYHDNEYLCAQKGLFTFWEVDSPSLFTSDGKPNTSLKTDRASLDVQLSNYLADNSIEKKEYLYHISIPQDSAKDIYHYVEKLGYNASTLFPGYDGVKRFLDEHKTI